MNTFSIVLSPFNAFKSLIKRNLHPLKRVLVLTVALYLAPSLSLQAHIAEGKGLGFNPLSQEQIQHAEDNWHAIVEVKTNKIGTERIKNHREEAGLHPLFQAPAQHAEELVLVQGQRLAAAHQAEPVAAVLPSSVDNSQLPSFPPIGDQKQLGSCVAWGTTYYQATHEYGLLNGINNKTSLKNVFSPKWTYNNLNGGVDGGLYIFETYQLFSQNGIVNIERLPYDSNYRTWDLNPQDWVSAISNRTAPGQLISGIGGASQNLQVIKQLLNNGHVLTFGTFINSWKTTTVKKDPAVPNSPHVGELAVAWMSGTNGGHCMTIVGYDDNVWIDVNNDGKVDAGEKGAFLIANSWGTSWGNKGFVWIAYDAFLTKSAVVKGPSYNRVAVADAMNSYVVSAVPIARNYSPKMYAQFSLTQTERDQISVAVGISDTNSKSPTKVFNSYALYNQGGSYEFDGTAPNSTAETATFALDLTDLLSAVSSSNKRFYLIVGDNERGNPTTVQSFSIVDNINNRTVQSKAVPLTVDNGKGLVYIDYDPAVVKTSSELVAAAPSLKITSPHADQVVERNLWLAATAHDPAGIERVEFYVDSVLFATDETAPYYVLLATQKLTKGAHELTAIAYNKNGESTAETVKFIVKN